MLDGIDTCGDQLARVRDRAVHGHPGAGVVHRGGELRYGFDRVGGLGAGACGQIGEIGDYLDPRRAPADLGERTDDEARLVHWFFQQVRK